MAKIKKSFIDKFCEQKMWKQSSTKNNLILFPTLPFIPDNIFPVGKCLWANMIELDLKKSDLVKVYSKHVKQDQILHFICEQSE